MANIRPCSKCDKPLNPDWEVCPFCGAWQQGNDGGAARIEPHPESGSEQPAEAPPVAGWSGTPCPAAASAPPEPLAVTPLKAESLPSGDEDYAIMLPTPRPLAPGTVTALGRTLAEILGRPLGDVTCPISTSKGFLARKVPARRLRQIAELLESLGIEAVLAPDARIAELPPLARTPKLEASGSRLACVITSEPEGTLRIEFEPAQVKLLLAGRVMYTGNVPINRRRYDFFERNPVLKRRHLNEKEAYEHLERQIHGYEYLIYLVIGEPRRLLRVDDQFLDYGRMLRRRGRPWKMQEQASLLIGALGGEPDPGLALLADLDENDIRWLPCTFAASKGLEAWVQWRYNLTLVEAQRPGGR